MTPHQQKLPQFKICKKGLHSYAAEDKCCLACRHEYEQNYWLLNKEQRSEYRKAYRKRNRENNTEQHQRQLVQSRKTLREFWARNREKAIWKGMVNRCTSPKNNQYVRYGGRGITVCDRWLGKNGFANFLKDMGLRPTHHHSLDRIDNEKGYYPKNCHWATSKEQQRNRRSNKLVTYKGETKCVAEWSEILGIQSATLFMRLRRWKDVDRAFTQEVR